MVTIRVMQQKDIEQMAAIESKCFSQPWSQKSFEEALSHKNLCFVTAVSGETIVGYCGLYMVLDEGYIINVAVREEYRRKHVAEDMLRFLISEGSKRKIAAFTLEVRESNKAAVGLYRKLGFETSGIRKNFYEKPIENAIIMWKS